MRRSLATRAASARRCWRQGQRSIRWRNRQRSRAAEACVWTTSGSTRPLAGRRAPLGRRPRAPQRPWAEWEANPAVSPLAKGLRHSAAGNYPTHKTGSDPKGISNPVAQRAQGVTMGDGMPEAEPEETAEV